MNGPAVLVTGGSGYVGRHVVWALLDAGHPVLNWDPRPCKPLPGERWCPESIAAETNLATAMRVHAVDAVVHLAARTAVGESVADPIGYYDANIAGGLSVLRAMRRASVSAIAFASSAAVYGEGAGRVLRESTEPVPINPYGRTKWHFEQILADVERAHGIRTASLRMFNVAGVSPAFATHGQSEALIFPLLRAVARRRSPITSLEYRAAGVFSDGYDTPDGTALRDYIHPADVGLAFSRTVSALRSGQSVGALNIATGRSVSIRAVVAEMTEVTGHRYSVDWQKPRPGFPAVLEASTGAAAERIGFRSRLGLDDIARSMHPRTDVSERTRMPSVRAPAG